MERLLAAIEQTVEEDNFRRIKEAPSLRITPEEYAESMEALRDSRRRRAAMMRELRERGL